MKKSHLLIVLVLAAFSAALTYYFVTTGGSPDGAKEWESRDETIAKLEGRMKELAKEIPRFQGHGICDVTDQCRLAGLGRRVCGNFKDYLVYSIKDADEAKLLPLVTEFNDANQRVSDLSLAAEECGVKPARIVCVQRRCAPVAEKN